LIVSIDGVVLKEVTLAKDRTTLGRRPYNDIVIDNLAVSGEHAVLHMVGSDVYLEDLHSTNGTYVNARPIQKQALEHEDVVEIGRYKLRFLATGGLPEGFGTVHIPPAPPASAPMPLFSTATAPLPLDGSVAGVAHIRVLTGNGAGREVALRKVVTTIGKPGIAVAAVTRRLQGYVVAPVDGGTTLNGELLGDDAVALRDGDVLELGGTRMQFVRD